MVKSLHSLSDWYVQLLSESLGKMSNTCLPYGRTPVPAVGTMDMHAQVQEHQEGRLNKVVQFIKVKRLEYIILLFLIHIVNMNTYMQLVI